MVKVVVHTHGANFSELSTSIDRFPDGTQHILVDKLAVDLYQHKGEDIGILWQYESDSELFTVISLRQALPRKLSLFLPYLPNARMDRTESIDDVFTLKSFCSVINSLNFDTVYVLDAHSSVSLALLDRVVDLNPAGLIIKAKACIESDDILLFYPDEGAMKRYSKTLHSSYAYANKVRAWQTGKIMSLEIVNKDIVPGKDILVVDDICSRGGTFLYAARELYELGAKNLYLYVSHAENTMFEGEMYKSHCYKQIFTTDSICKPASKDIYHCVTRFSWAEAL